MDLMVFPSVYDMISEEDLELTKVFRIDLWDIPVSVFNAYLVGDDRMMDSLWHSIVISLVSNEEYPEYEPLCKLFCQQQTQVQQALFRIYNIVKTDYHHRLQLCGVSNMQFNQPYDTHITLTAVLLIWNPL